MLHGQATPQANCFMKIHSKIKPMDGQYIACPQIYDA